MEQGQGLQRPKSRKREDWVGSGGWEPMRTWEGEECDPEAREVELGPGQGQVSGGSGVGDGAEVGLSH